MLNAFTVDLEDWYQGLEIAPSEWEAFEDRLEIGCGRLLLLLEEAGVKATFFVLGYAAERFPDLIAEIASRGHEIGTHGHGHEFVYNLGAERFRSDLVHSIEILSDILGSPAGIRGHRAPYFSITRGCEWAFDVLQESGITYDSSIFPVRNYRYGIPQAPRTIHRVRDGLIEFPPSTLPIGGHNLPIAGGAYFRLLPYTLTRSCMRRLNAAGEPVAFYIHPWELDPGQPRLPLPRRIGLTHYWNLGSTEARLRRLLSDFRFTTMGSLVGTVDAETVEAVDYASAGGPSR